jgi:transcriptional regulator with XRE-family HTH domain
MKKAQVVRPNRLKAIREAKGMTARALAIRIGVHDVTVYKYESGATKPSLPVQFLIAQILDTDIDEVFPLREEAS